jgi:hypothetical protein
MICVRGNDGNVRSYNDIIKQYGSRFTLTE